MARTHHIVSAAASLLLASGVQAQAIGITMLSDTPFTASARITGEIPGFGDPRWSNEHGPDVLMGLGGVPANGSYEFWRVINDLEAGSNWNVEARIYFRAFYDVNDNLLASSTHLSITGQHMVNPHPDTHPNELAPNPVTLDVWHWNLTGATSTDPLVSQYLSSVNLSNTEVHPVGPHSDTATLTITDLNGTGAGLMNGPDLMAVVEFKHPVPAPATMMLGLSGLLLAIRRRR